MWFKLYLLGAVSRIDYFEKGREHYNRKEYAEAVSCFLRSITEDYYNTPRAWLGLCYECGLGVAKDRVLAKDLYSRCYDRLSFSKRDEKFGLWVAQHLENLKDVAECDSRRVFIEGLGNVKVIRNINAPYKPQFRYNVDEVVVQTDKRTTLVEGLCYAQKHLPDINRGWTCDGQRRYYDGYTLETDYFNLRVLRGATDKYISKVEGRECLLHFPKGANLDYVYVQETIHKKVRQMLFKRTQEVVPPILKEVSERINVPYGKCEVVMTHRSFVAYNIGTNHDIYFTASSIQLPKESLETLCIHELTHNFVSEHGKDFYDKMAELGGEEAVKRDKSMWKEGRWPYLRM